MAINCINCGNYASYGALSITQYGLVPVCGFECLSELNNSDAPLDRLQQSYLDNFLNQEEKSNGVSEKRSEEMPW